MPTTPATAGQLLKKARQAKGLHLAVLAVSLKVPVRQLEALEADDYSAFKGGPAFLRAITGSMCRQLGIDPAPVLALLPSAVKVMGVVRPPLESVSGLQKVSMRSARSLPRSGRAVMVLAALMLLGTAAFLWLPAPEVWWPRFSNSGAVTPTVEELAVPLGQSSDPQISPGALPESASNPAGPTVSPVPLLPASAPNSGLVTFPAQVLAVADGGDKHKTLGSSAGPIQSPSAAQSAQAQDNPASPLLVLNIQSPQPSAKTEVKE